MKSYVLTHKKFKNVYKKLPRKYENWYQYMEQLNDKKSKLTKLIRHSNQISLSS